MRAAVPTWNGRVSPLFDTARRLTVAEVAGGKVAIREERPIDAPFPPWRVRLLADLGVEVLICGGISRPLAAMLSAAGIRIVPWIAGEVGEVLEAFARGRLDGEVHGMPGCRRRRRRFRRPPGPWWR